MPCGCPSSRIDVFPSSLLTTQAGKTVRAEGTRSALAHWPVQIRLIPPDAPFLRHADLLIAADCTPLAYAGFHKDLLPGKVVMLGCPKLGDTEAYVTKLTDILTVAGVRSITVAEVEVPCCSRLPMIVKSALARAGKEVPLEEIIISRRGAIKERRLRAAS
jgi:hypothetical protein